MLFLTHTTVSVPALTGAIMCMGVATANSVLVISFAREQMNEGKDAREAALEAGFTRLRPVIMTATAMIIGMIPMALGLGESGEQNAPLGPRRHRRIGLRHRRDAVFRAHGISRSFTAASGTARQRGGDTGRRRTHMVEQDSAAAPPQAQVESEALCA